MKTDRDPVKSVGNGVTYPQDLLSANEIYSHLLALSDSVAGRLRREGKKGRTVQISVKDPMLTTLQRQKKLDRPSYLAKEIAVAAMDLLSANWKVGTAPIRALTVTVSDLVDADGYPTQYSLLPSEGEVRSEKQEKVELAMDRLRGRFGKDIITFGASSRRDDPEASDKHKFE